MAIAPNIWNLMTPEDQQKFADDAPFEATFKLLPIKDTGQSLERDEQNLFRNELHRREIVFSCPRTDRKSTVTKGLCDFIVFLDFPSVLLIEFKGPQGRISEEQELVFGRLGKHGWQVKIVRSFSEAKALLEWHLGK